LCRPSEVPGNGAITGGGPGLISVRMFGIPGVRISGRGRVEWVWFAIRLA